MGTQSEHHVPLKESIWRPKRLISQVEKVVGKKRIANFDILLTKGLDYVVLPNH